MANSRLLAWIRGSAVVLLGISTTARLGLAGAVTPDAGRLLDRAPITVQQVVAYDRDSWL